MEPNYNLTFKDKVMATGSLDQCMIALMELVGQHASISTIITNGWRLHHERRNVQ